MEAFPDFRTLLVSTDFSDYGDAAIAQAFRLAKDYGARVVLLHVLDARPPVNPLYAHYYPIPTPEQNRQAEAKAAEELRARIPVELRDSNRVETLVTQGSPAPEILRIAGEQQASLIVIATHGRTGLHHFALGSVAERVIRHAPCPVLVVR
jgi:nucleotide-binding universal stress UspA family protein